VAALDDAVKLFGVPDAFGRAMDVRPRSAEEERPDPFSAM